MTSMAFDLEDVMKDKIKTGYVMEDLYKIANKKQVCREKISNVKHWVYKPCWSYRCGNDECFISIYQVLLQKRKFTDHHRRIRNASLEYPLIIVKDKYDKYGTILDGNHRFAKSLLKNKKFINYVYLTKSDLDKIRVRA